MKIAILPGHGGRDSGAHHHGVAEKDVVLGVSLELADVLERAGIEITLSREDDTFVGLKQQAQMANRFGADLCMSIHANAAENHNAQGAEVWASPGSPARGFASSLEAWLVTALVTPWRGVKESRFYVLVHTKMPAVLIELDFVSNARRAAQLADPHTQKVIADHIGLATLAWILREPAGRPGG